MFVSPLMILREYLSHAHPSGQAGWHCGHQNLENHTGVGPGHFRILGPQKKYTLKLNQFKQIIFELICM